MEPEIIEDLDTPGELEAGHTRVVTTTLSDAKQSLRRWVLEAEERFRLTPLEVLGVLSGVLNDCLTSEGEGEREALGALQKNMALEILDPVEDEQPGPPTCCRKHNMMGRDDGGECKGGPVAGGTPKRRVTLESGDWDPEAGAEARER
jgi:hypothetical protein